MDQLFNPKSIAVIGVSERETNLARNILKNLFDFSYDGIIYAVGVKGGHVFGKPIHKSVSEISDPVDLALILTPADTIPGIVKECGKKGIKNLVIESGGFGEYGAVGKERQDRLVEVAKKYGIKFIGPNCIGLINFHNGLFLPFLVLKNIYKKGNVSIVTQSGGVGLSFLNLFAGQQLGIAKFASIGNKLDIDENDVIEYYLQDDETEIIVVYLEGISDGRRLVELARSSNKPILLYKANTGQLGKVIAASHTAALSSDDKVVDAALKQVGIARIRDRQTLIDYIKVLPLPKVKGNNLAILSRSGGYAIQAADAAENNGFALAPFKKSLLKSIEKHFRASVIKLTNPLDLGDVFDFDLYLKIIEMTVREKDVHAVVFFHACFSDAEIPPTKNLIEKSYELSIKYGKPVLICMEMDAGGLYKLRGELKPPVFNSVRETIRSLALDRDFHHEIQARPKEANFDVNFKAAKRLIDSCQKEKRSPELHEGLEIFSAYGIPTAKNIFAKNEKELLDAADRIGYPAAFKVVSEDISHKTDVGGVAINLRNPDSIKVAYHEMMERIKKEMPKARVDGVSVQPMMNNGFEMIVGAKRDQNFGPIVLAGLGGIFVEVFKDLSIRVIPFEEKEARSMLSDLKGYPILQGARSGKPLDINSISNCILRLSKLITDFPEISEVDINPFYVMPEGKGGFALDARIVF